MGMLINEKKLKAAIGSMHQFCHPVREIFPGDVDDCVVESATLYLYTSLARDLFGPRFAGKLQKKLYERLKYTTRAEIQGHIARITKTSDALEKAEHTTSHDHSPEEVVRAHVTSTIEAMLADAGFSYDDAEVIKKAYDRFERAIKIIRQHLIGIREQNVYLMKNRNVA